MGESCFNAKFNVWKGHIMCTLSLVD